MTGSSVHTTDARSPPGSSDFIGRWEDGWNSHVPERLLALMTEDIEYEDSAWPTVMHGHADVRAFLDVGLDARMPDLRFEMVAGPFVGVSDAPSAAFYWRGTGASPGRWTRPASRRPGKPLEFYGADFHEYRDGRVVPAADRVRQHGRGAAGGAAAAAGSRADRAGAAAQRLAMRVRGLRRP